MSYKLAGRLAVLLVAVLSFTLSAYAEEIEVENPPPVVETPESPPPDGTVPVLVENATLPVEVQNAHDYSEQLQQITDGISALRDEFIQEDLAEAQAEEEEFISALEKPFSEYTVSETLLLILTVLALLGCSVKVFSYFL